MTDWRQISDFVLWIFAITGTMIFSGLMLYLLSQTILTWTSNQTQLVIGLLQAVVIIIVIIWMCLGTSSFFMLIWTKMENRNK